MVPQISAPPNDETALDLQKFLRCNDMLKGLYHPITMNSLVGLGSHLPLGWQNCQVFCLFVHHALECQSSCTGFHHESIGIQKQFWYRLIGEGLYLCTCVQLSQITANRWHHKMLKSKCGKIWGVFGNRGRQNKLIKTKFGMLAKTMSLL